MSSDLPVPPFPAPAGAALRAIIEMAMEALENGETDVRGAAEYAAVHGWLEGHLEGEGCESDCRHNVRWQLLHYPDSRESA